MTNDEIRKMYDGKSLAEIETALSKHNNTSLESRKQFVIGLNYLRMTVLYKQDKRFSRASFEEYLQGRWMMGLHTFNRESLILINYTEAAEKHGIGTINQIMHKCGKSKLKPLIKEVDKIATQSKGRDYREKVDRLIEKNLKPAVKKATMEPTKTEMKRESTERKKLMDSQNGIIRELTEQVRKLKASVEYYKPFKAKYEELLKLVGPVAAFAKKSQPEMRVN